MKIEELHLKQDVWLEDGTPVKAVGLVLTDKGPKVEIRKERGTTGHTVTMVTIDKLSATRPLKALRNNTTENIGLTKIGLAKQIVQALYEGKTVHLHHGAFGHHIVNMNSQKNRIYSMPDPNSSKIARQLEEDRLASMILWGYGAWFVETQGDINGSKT